MDWLAFFVNEAAFWAPMWLYARPRRSPVVFPDFGPIPRPPCDEGHDDSSCVSANPEVK